MIFGDVSWFMVGLRVICEGYFVFLDFKSFRKLFSKFSWLAGKWNLEIARNKIKFVFKLNGTKVN